MVYLAARDRPIKNWNAREALPLLKVYRFMELVTNPTIEGSVAFTLGLQIDGL